MPMTPMFGYFRHGYPWSLAMVIPIKRDAEAPRIDHDQIVWFCLLPQFLRNSVDVRVWSMKLSPTRERKDNQYPDDDDEPEKTHPNDTREDRRDELHCSGHDGEQGHRDDPGRQQPQGHRGEDPDLTGAVESLGGRYTYGQLRIYRSVAQRAKS